MKNIIGKMSAVVCGVMMLLCGCGQSLRDGGSVEAVADSFSVCYFNWRFPEAVKFVDEASVKWLRYASSQVHQSDIDLLREKAAGATIEVEDVAWQGDSMALVRLKISDFLAMDTIGTAAHAVEQAWVVVPVGRNGGHDRWLVHLDELPKLIDSGGDNPGE